MNYDALASFQRDNGSVDAHGNRVANWQEYAKSYVHIQDSGGRELYRAQQVQPQVTTVITTRDRIASALARDRIVVTDSMNVARTFEIASITGLSDRSAASELHIAAIERPGP